MKINWQPTHLEDNELKLIPLQVSDFEQLFTVASDPLIWEQHPEKERYKREVFQKFFDGAIASESAFLILNSNDEIIGSTRFYNFSESESSVSIGFTFMARHYWGGIYNKRVKKLLLDYAFQYVDKVFFHIGLENIRSQKAVQKLGAQKDRIVDFDHYGEKVSHYQYVLDKDTWRAK